MVCHGVVRKRFINEINHLGHILKQFQLQKMQQKQALTTRCESDA
jgi:hypothetical protein